MKKIALIALTVLLIAGTAFAGGKKEAAPVYEPTTATKYFVAHQGGYVGEAKVSIDAMGKVTSATLVEWQGPGGYAEAKAGAVVRVPDPFANASNADPAIKGYMFYVYNLQADGKTYIWSQYSPGKEAFGLPTRQYERDFEGLMSNPIRAAAYAKAAAEDKLVNVTIDGLKVMVGESASKTVHYGNMDKANPNSNYMPITATSTGYRFNNKATLEFFKANPTADFTSATTKKMKLTLSEDKAIDATGKVADYTAADDMVYVVADAVTGATYSDFQHYSMELQAAYKMALADQRLKAGK